MLRGRPVGRKRGQSPGRDRVDADFLIVQPVDTHQRIRQLAAVHRGREPLVLPHARTARPELRRRPLPVDLLVPVGSGHDHQPIFSAAQAEAVFDGDVNPLKGIGLGPVFGADLAGHGHPARVIGRADPFSPIPTRWLATLRRSALASSIRRRFRSIPSSV